MKDDRVKSNYQTIQSPLPVRIVHQLNPCCLNNILLYPTSIVMDEGASCVLLLKNT